MKRKNPSTSLEAHARLDPIKVSQTMVKISEAIKVLGKANYEDVAAYLGEPEPKIWKRFTDCMKAKLIHRTEETKKTKHGYKSYLFAYGPTIEEVKKKERVMRGKSVADYSKAILNQPKPSKRTEENLFSL
jgi:hypothetical protein